MFGWLKKQVSNFRFELAFQRYEHDERSRNLAEAEQRFSTVELRAEISSLCTIIETEADELFLANLQDVRGEIAVCASDLSTRDWQLGLLKRDYRTELSNLYETLNDMNQQIDDLYEEKEDAVERKDRAKANIAEWHDDFQRNRKKGKKIPQHSLFGQSFGDLDGYQSERDAASAEIMACAEAISNLKDQKREVGEQIGSTKKCRDEMHALRNRGVTRKSLTTEIAAYRADMSRLLEWKTKLENDRASFVNTARQHYGVIDRETAAAELDAQKTAFVAAFETRHSHLRRRVLYRRIFEAPKPSSSRSPAAPR